MQPVPISRKKFARKLAQAVSQLGAGQGHQTNGCVHCAHSEQVFLSFWQHAGKLLDGGESPHLQNNVSLSLSYPEPDKKIYESKKFSFESEYDPPCLIDQLDGNMSINSSFSIFESDDVYQIPNQIGYRPANAIYERPLSTLKTIRRDNRKVEALTLPRIVNYNMRSFFPKCANFAQDVHERESDAIFLTEVWEKQENKKHQNKIE